MSSSTKVMAVVGMILAFPATGAVALASASSHRRSYPSGCRRPKPTRFRGGRSATARLVPPLIGIVEKVQPEAMFLDRTPLPARQPS